MGRLISLKVVVSVLLCGVAEGFLFHLRLDSEVISKSLLSPGGALPLFSSRKSRVLKWTPMWFLGGGT